jgi:hypothetical protein
MEFQIDSVHELEGIYCVTGRCYQGSNKENFLKIGDRFLKVYKNILKATPEGYFEVAGRENIRDVKLQIKEIKAYGHSLDELYSGMSGELYLIGEGGASLRNRDVLEVL